MGKPRMKYSQKTFFLVKGEFEFDKIVGNDESFILCDDYGYLLKYAVHSSVILLCRNQELSTVNYVLEAFEFPKECPYEYIPLSIPSKMVCIKVDEIRIKFRLGSKEFSDIAESFFLIFDKENVYKLSYAFWLKISMYMRSLKLTCSDIKSELNIYNKIIKDWAMNKITGELDELIIFFLLSCWENKNFNGWKEELEKILLESVNLERIVKLFTESNVNMKIKDSVVSKISCL